MKKHSLYNKNNHQPLSIRFEMCLTRIAQKIMKIPIIFRENPVRIFVNASYS